MIKVGIDIIDWSFIKRAHKVSFKAAALMYGVLLLTVFVDLITAVAIGIFITNLLAIKRLSDIQIDNIKTATTPHEELHLSEEENSILRKADGNILLFRFGGPMSFGAAKAISQQMSIVEDYHVLILDLSDVPYIGITAALAIENIVKEACEKRREVFLVGASGSVQSRLNRLKIWERLPVRNRETNRLEALRQAINLVKEYSTKKQKIKISHHS